MIETEYLLQMSRTLKNIAIYIENCKKFKNIAAKVLLMSKNYCEKKSTKIKNLLHEFSNYFVAKRTKFTIKKLKN